LNVKFDPVQGEAWKNQQRRLLTAQFGPREVESLAMNAVLPMDEEELQGSSPVRWIQERELREVQVGHRSFSPPKQKRRIWL
jgi:hypothetical protein